MLHNYNFLIVEPELWMLDGGTDLRGGDFHCCVTPIGSDDYIDKFLDTKLVKEHGYCLKINNDQVNDSISRSDEQKILGTNQPTVGWPSVKTMVMMVSSALSDVSCKHIRTLDTIISMGRNATYVG